MNPLVSAIMVTGKSPGRVPWALAAVKAFQLQSYSPLELIIVNDSQDRLLEQLPEPDHRIREIMVSPRKLGLLRNVGLDAAKGEFIVQWDDDDFYRFDRIEQQMATMRKKLPVTLSHQVRYSFVTNNAFIWRGILQDDKRWMGIPGTILHPKTDFRYGAERRHEDSRFMKQWKHITVLENEQSPQIYLRFFNGLNTWTSGHIMGRIDNRATNKWHLPTEAHRYLKTVLEIYYRHATNT